MGSKLRYKVKMDTLIAWGASVVIIGLMFKLLHWPGGHMLIGVGLGVEAFLFFIIGVNSLKGGEEKSEAEDSATAQNSANARSRERDQATVDMLKNNFENFTGTVEAINNMTNTTVQSTDMMREMEKATQQIKNMHRNLSELNAYYSAQLDAFRKPSN